MSGGGLGSEERRGARGPGRVGQGRHRGRGRPGGSTAPRVPAVWSVCGAHPEGRHRQPRRGSLELPAGLQRRIPLRQDLEAALEEPHVPVPQEIQPLSIPAPRQPLLLRGRHAAPEATLTAIRKQSAGGAKSTAAGFPQVSVQWAPGACLRPRRQREPQAGDHRKIQ